MYIILGQLYQSTEMVHKMRIMNKLFSFVNKNLLPVELLLFSALTTYTNLVCPANSIQTYETHVRILIHQSIN